MNVHTGDTGIRVLVAAASRHGATLEIAEEIGRVIGDAMAPGANVDVRRAEDVSLDDAYDAAIVGSAVYIGQWLHPARRLAEAVAAMRPSAPLWLFSSGPIGDPPHPKEAPAEAPDLISRTGAREHVVFAGRLDKRDLRFKERAVVAAVRAPAGDFRDWAAIGRWAQHVASELGAMQAMASHPSTTREAE